MKLKIIACGVLEPELKHLAPQSPHDVVVELLEAGLHDRPDLLRQQTQEAIERAEAEGFDALALGYGLCGRGVAGLIARTIPVVIPRAHDCMTLFMGSRAAYRKQFAADPGTFYITPGWYENKVRPLGHDKEKHYDAGTVVEQDSRFPALAEKYGPERAAYIIHFHDSWKRNYTRAAYIDTGYPEPEKYQAYAQQMAEDLGWRYECIPGDPHLLRKLVSGEWDEDEFLVLQPGQRSGASGDEGILTGISIEAGADPILPTAPEGSQSSNGQNGVCPHCTEEKKMGTVPIAEAPVVASPTVAGRDGDSPRGTLGLGIDAGGTYTDCVLYDLDHRTVVAKAKAITTHHNLMLGIDEGLQKLAETVAGPPSGVAGHPATSLTEVRVVALSTTLATNSIVEGKGGRPGAIIMSPLTAPGADINWRPLRHVSGAMDIRGDELEEPDRDEIAQAVKDLLAEGVDAFAVSGYASVRNPSHELLVRETIREQCDLPVICGHELSQRLDYLARANTAILNARLLGVVGKLLEAVKASLVGIGVAAPVMVVKGDGSLSNEQTARERPVETVLSGPAASVSGARHLTDIAEGIVFDMGGTTTDSAVLSQGMTRLHPEGARVGGWRTSVEAAQIETVGLGGDSHIAFNADRDLLIGPRRVLPICYLVAQAPAMMAALRAIDPRFITNRNNSQALEFFQLGRDHEDTLLDDRDRRIVEALQEGPLSREGLSRRVGLIEASLLRTERLEDLGFVQRSSLTPTDLLHVTGEFTGWDTAAAELALSIFAELYGASPETVIARVRDEIVRRLCLQALGHIVDRHSGTVRTASSSVRAASSREGLAEHLLDLGLAGKPAGPLQVTFAYCDTLVALGAPVHPFFPEVARRLNARLIIPEHAEVANAIGAVASEVVVREKTVVRPGEISAFVVHSRSGKREYDRLEYALNAAKQEAETLAVERAARSGAASPKLRLDVDERRGLLADGQEELIEIIVEATASGRPMLEVAT